MALAGSLEVQLYANVARLVEDMAKMESAVNGSLGRVERAAQTAMTALGALGSGLSVAAFAGMIKGALDAADALNKLQQRTGLATEFLSQLQYAAKLADVSNESLATSMRRLPASTTSRPALKNGALMTPRPLSDPEAPLISMAVPD